MCEGCDAGGSDFWEGAWGAKGEGRMGWGRSGAPFLLGGGEVGLPHCVGALETAALRRRGAFDMCFGCVDKGMVWGGWVFRFRDVLRGFSFCTCNI